MKLCNLKLTCTGQIKGNRYRGRICFLAPIKVMVFRKQSLKLMRVIPENMFQMEEMQLWGQSVN